MQPKRFIDEIQNDPYIEGLTLTEHKDKGIERNEF